MRLKSNTKSRRSRNQLDQMMLSLYQEIPYAHPAIQPPKWSDEDILLLMEKMLMRELSTVANMGLGARSGAKRREEAWEWILEDSSHPFSFNSCAAGVGVQPSTLRISFARVVMRSQSAHEADRDRAKEVLQKYGRGTS